MSALDVFWWVIAVWISGRLMWSLVKVHFVSGSPSRPATTRCEANHAAVPLAAVLGVRDGLDRS